MFNSADQFNFSFIKLCYIIGYYIQIILSNQTYTDNNSNSVYDLL